MISGEPISGGPISSAPWVAPGAGGGDITGDGSVTQGADTGSASASVTIGATASGTQAADTVAAVAAVVISAAGSATQSADTGAAAGTGTVGATGDATQGNDTGSATASGLIDATGSAAQGGDTGSAIATVALSASGSATQAADTGAATATNGAPDTPGAPGGTVRRSAPTWLRAARRSGPTLARSWRYTVALATRSDQTLIAAVSDDRDYAFDLSSCPEVVGGATVASAEITGGTGLTIGAPAANASAFDGIPIGKAVVVRIGGGVAGATYDLACVATLSTGRKVVVPARLRKVADRDS